MNYSATELADAVKRHACLPNAENLFKTPQIIKFMNDAQRITIVPWMIQTMGEYFVASEDVDLSSFGTTQGPVRIPVPSDAVGSKIRSMSWVDTNGNLVTPPIPQLALDSAYNLAMTPEQVYGFYFEGNDIILFPNSTFGTGRIRLFYHKRRGELLELSLAPTVKQINTNTNELLLSNLPVAWEVGDILNTVSSRQAFNYTAEELEVLTLSSPTVGLSSVEGIAVGDYLCAAGYTPIPQMPVEAHDVLVTATVCRILISFKDVDGLKIAGDELALQQSNLINILAPRSDGAARKVVPSGAIRAMGPYTRGIW